MICKECEIDINSEQYNSTGLCSICELGCLKEDESCVVRQEEAT